MRKPAASYFLAPFDTRLRLSRWGAAAGICLSLGAAGAEPGAVMPVTDGSGIAIPENDQEDAEHFLWKITQLFNDAKAESDAMKSPAPLFDPNADLPPRGKRLRLRLLALVERRRVRIIDQVNHIKWAFYKKDRFDEFINKISELIKELEELFPQQPKSKLDELSQEEFEDIGTSNLKVLKDVVDCDPPLGVLVKEALKKQEQSKQKSVSVLAENNYGLQQGINYGEMKGLIFGTGYHITQSWGGKEQ